MNKIKYWLLSKFVESHVNYKKEYNDDTINFAKGEVIKMNFSKSSFKGIDFGTRLVGHQTENDIEYDYIWVYLGNNYAKIISKVKT